MTRAEWEQQKTELQRKLRKTIPGSPEEAELRRQLRELEKLELSEPDLEQGRNARSSRDYFEHVDGNVYTAPVTIIQQDAVAPDDAERKQVDEKAPTERREQRIGKSLRLKIGGLLFLGGALWILHHLFATEATLSDLTNILIHPLSLVGEVLLLVFGVHRLLVKSHILPPVDAIQGSEIVKRILHYGFVIAIITIIGGFGLAALNTSLEHRGRNQPAKPRRYRFDADQNGVQSLSLLFKKVADEGIVQLEFVPRHLQNVIVCDTERPDLTLADETSTKILHTYITQLYSACFRWEKEGIIVRIHANLDENTLLTRRDAVQGGEHWFCNCANETIARLLQQAAQRMENQE
jgi:hypothetical protein